MNDSLRGVREIWAERAGARTRGDILYLLYVAALSVLILLVPALRMAGAFLARPDVLPALLAAHAPQVTAAMTLAGGAALVLLGAVRGPALLAPFFTATLASSGLRRRDVLWRPLARALLGPVLGMVTLSVLVASTLVMAAQATPAGAAWFVLAATGTGMLLGAAWFAGELLREGPRRLLAGGLLGAAAVLALFPHGAGLGAAYPVGADRPEAWAVALLVAGLAAVGACVALLDRLRGAVLREQAARWETATTVATSGDLVAASGAFRTPPSTGRHLPAIGPRPLVLLYARRDAIAWLRTPERAVLGVVVALAAAAGLAGSTLLSGPRAWAAVLLGALALWGASGALVDGIRHGVHTLGAPRLFGQSAAAQVILHAVAPTALLAVLGAAGGAGVLLASGGGAGPAALLLPALLAPVLVAGRVRDAAKGPMPLALSTPMPTPQGDLVVLPMLAWHSDALLLALLSGAVLAGLGTAGPLWLPAGAAVLLAGMSLMAAGRLRELAR